MPPPGTPPERPVAYLWSPALQAAADALPANKGRSSRVHALICALGLVKPGEAKDKDVDEAEGEDGNGRENGHRHKGNDVPDLGCGPHADGKKTPRPFTPARLVAPDLALATEAELRRYHDKRYVQYILRNGADGDDDDKHSDSDDESENDDGEGRRKRRRVMAGLEYDCPPFAQLSAYARLVAASTLTACRLLTQKKARTAIVWDGGRHHALRAQASGFCYVADAVLGILYLCREGVPFGAAWGEEEAVEEVKSTQGGQDGSGDEKDDEDDKDEDNDANDTGNVHDNSNGTDDDNDNETPPSPPPPPPPPPRALPTRRARILYLDMDLHYGDGVAQAFASPVHYPHPLNGKRPRAPQVLTLSVHHCAPIFFPPGAPGLTPRATPHPFSLSYPLAAYAHSATYFRAWACVERIAAAWAPDYVVLQLGVDGLPRDPVGMYGAWGVSGPGSVPWVVEQVTKWRRPTVVLGGGGYVSDNAARAWALSTARIVGAELEPEDSVPDHAFWSEYAPAYTLEVPESHIPDENTAEMLDAADAEFGVLAERIRELVALNA